MTTQPKIPKKRRKRGVILTAAGLARFLAAKSDAEFAENEGHRYTLEALSELTGVSIDTLTKVLSCELRVDRQTLKCCFQAFDLMLGTADYYKPGASVTSLTTVPGSGAFTPSSVQSETATVFMPSPPGGQLSPASSLYVPRVRAEVDGAAAIDRPGALLRIRGARQTGKTSLMARLAQHAVKQGYQPVLISFQLAEKSVLQDLESLLKWFCASVGLGLGRPSELDTYWDSLFGSKVSCKLYFEQYLLAASDRPVVLMLDDVERLFRDLEVADEFFGLLRTWYEEAKTSEVWKRLRIAIAQSSEVYIPLNINKSPFNVGLAVPLHPFTAEDIQTMAAAYRLTWSLESAAALRELVQGQPYLVHLTIDYVWRTHTPLADIVADPLGSHVFLPYLQHHLCQVQQQPALVAVLSQLLEDKTPAPETLADVYRLQSMGLVTLCDDGPKLSCCLFSQYFSQYFSEVLPVLVAAQD